ncbi:SLC13 family permease [Shewanella gelidii]|nr:SLC13 family permease [Shewanella gelidii]MCL1098799.1 hypothetical protein [Shewanella gelidii]
MLVTIIGGFLFISPFSMAEQGFLLFLFAMLLWGGNLLPILHATIIIPILAIALGLISFTDVTTILLSPILAIFIFGFAFACFSQEQGLDKVVLHTVNKFSKGHERVASYLLFALTCFISMWTSNVVTAALMLPVVMSINTTFQHKGDKQPSQNSKTHYLAVGVVFSATLGGMCTQVGSSTSLIASSLAQLDFIGWLIGALPIVTLLWLAMLLLLEIYFKPQFRKKLTLPPPEPLSAAQKWGLVIVIGTLLLWVIAAAVLRGETKLYGLIPLVSVAILLAKRFISIQGAVNAIRWRVIVIFVSAFTLGKVLHASGGGQLIVDWVTPLLSNSSIWIQLAIFLLLLVTMTEFMSNVACASLFAPVLFLLLIPQGVSVEQVALMAGIGGSFAFVLPTATPANNLAYAHQYVTRRTMIGFGGSFKAAATLILFACLIVFH